MKFYHGTTTKFLAQTLQHGLRPRAKRASNWKDNPSRKDMVYLTTTYPFYFATPTKGDEKAVVFEIDAKKLDETLLYPDEDYVVHVATERLGKPLTKEQRKRVCTDLDLFQKMWRKSLAFLGNCAYRGTIPAKAITRYCLFDAAARPELAFHFMDASISLLNHEHQGREHRQVIEWCFGDRKRLPMVAEAETEEELMFWVAQSRDRTGVEVVERDAKEYLR